MLNKISKHITEISVSDFTKKEKFENLLPIPEGVSYNSYLITDEKTALLDGCDATVGEEYFKSVQDALGGRKLDYIVVNHLEPDHGWAIGRLMYAFPDATVIGNAKTKAMLSDYVSPDYAERVSVIADGATLELGESKLTFIMTPMVHWPESMMCYDACSQTLFAQDAFGAFGAVTEPEDAEGGLGDEYVALMRRYYANIVGKYGAQVQNVLKKAAALEINAICPIHGKVIKRNIAEAVELYGKWSTYTPEEKAVVVACASMYGNMKSAVYELGEMLIEYGVKVVLCDITKLDASYVLANVFRVSHAVFASVTYNGAMFPKMEYLLNDIKAQGVKGRKFSLIESGSWAPVSGKLMADKLAEMKDWEKVGDTVSFKCASYDREKLKELARAIANDIYPQ